MTTPRPRLFLVTPRAVALSAFLPKLEAALSAGDAASLLITPDMDEDAGFQKVAEAVAAVAQKNGVAAIVANDSRVTGRAGADGIHIDTGVDDLTDAIERFQPKNFVGAGGLFDRHTAMLAAERGADYVFFGRIDREEAPGAHPANIALGEWWSSLFEPPCVVMAGADLATVDAVLDAGADFIGMRAAVWSHPGGPAEAVQFANARIDAFGGDAP
ncbi:thiamine-phosphate pyrophosphorylase [Rhodobium orientis]|nr:thiamine phosphate synthase [Rhodobium orientis]MBB4302991.1 thiamine-phosphate pyrophosphorylase [Rhodobium orientis]